MLSVGWVFLFLFDWDSCDLVVGELGWVYLASVLYLCHFGRVGWVGGRGGLDGVEVSG